MSDELIEHYLGDEAAMVAAGRALGCALQNKLDAAGPAWLVFLQGDLGAGKTTFCRGVLEGFGHQGAVKSPTYTLVEPYSFAHTSVYHFDLYRLGDPEELEYMGFRDYLTGASLCLIEWPEKASGLLPQADLIVELTSKSPGRKLRLSAVTARARALLPSVQVKV